MCNYISFHPAVTPGLSLSHVFVTHMFTCKKQIRNLVMRLHGREINVLQEKSSRGNLVSLIPDPDYRHQVSLLHERLGISFPQKDDCNLDTEVHVNAMTGRSCFFF